MSRTRSKSDAMTKSHVPLGLTVALAVTMMLGPFSMDTYLPAFPRMAADLGVSAADIALSVSCYVFSLALSQLVGGALSDQIGRRQVLLGGLGIYVVASVAISLSANLPLLLAGRVAQAFGAGWVAVSVPALVRDRVTGQEAAKLFSLIGLIVVIAPAVAPSAGSAILRFASWRWVFVFLAAYAVFLVPVARRVIFASSATRAVRPGSAGLLRRYLEVLRTGPAWPYVVWLTASFSVMMVFITHASFIYQEHFGQDPGRFALLFSANIVAMLGFNLCNRALLNRLRSLDILRLGTVAQTLGIVLLLLATFNAWPLWAFLPAMMLSVGALGAIGPNLQALYLDHFPQNSGTAAAILGATEFGTAGLVSALSTRLPHTLPSVVGTMAVLALVPLAMLALTRRRGREAATPAAR